MYFFVEKSLSTPRGCGSILRFGGQHLGQHLSHLKQNEHKNPFQAKNVELAFAGMLASVDSALIVFDINGSSVSPLLRQHRYRGYSLTNTQLLANYRCLKLPNLETATQLIYNPRSHWLIWPNACASRPVIGRLLTVGFLSRKDKMAARFSLPSRFDQCQFCANILVIIEPVWPILLDM